MGSWWELNEMMREVLVGSRSLLAAVEQSVTCHVILRKELAVHRVERWGVLTGAPAHVPDGQSSPGLRLSRWR